MFSPRFAFLLGTLFAVVGTVDAAATTCTGASGKFNTEDNPGGTGVIACKCVVGYVSTGASNTAVIGDVALSCTKCAPGYYFSSGSATVNAVCTQAPANKWHAGLKDLTSTYTAQTLNSCPTNSESVAGSSAMADCKVKAGYYISVEADSSIDDTNLAILIAPQNWYAPGGASATLQDSTSPGIVAATRTICPYAGTTPATGKTALTDCVVTCGADGVKAKAQGGTCVCEATHYGKPVNAILSTSSAPTQGCVGIPVLTIESAKITAADNKIEPPASHGATVGDLFMFTYGGTSLGAGTPPLTTKTYMVAAVTSGKFTVRIMDIPANPADAAVCGFAANSDAAATLTPAGKVITTSAISGNVLTSPAHGLSTDDQVLYQRGGGTVQGGLTDNDTTNYFVIVLSATTFSLAAKPGGAAIVLSGGVTTVDSFKYTGVKGITIPTAGIAIASDTITFAAHGLSNGDQVIYNNGAGADAAGLTNGVRYFLRDVTTNTFKVSAMPGGSAADITDTGNAAQYFTTVGLSNLAQNVNVVGGACPTNSEVATLATDGDGVTALGQCSIKAGFYISTIADGIGDATSLVIKAATPNFYAAGGNAVDERRTAAVTATRTACPFAGTTAAGKNLIIPTTAVASNTITYNAHGLSDGDQVTYTEAVTVITNLVTATTYFVRDATTNTFKVAATSGGTAITLGSTGANTQYFTPAGKILVTDCTPATSIVIPALTSDQITNKVMTSSAHGLKNGDELIYKDTGGTSQDNIADGAKVYVKATAADTFQLSATPGAAAAIVLTVGNNDQYFIIPSASACGAASVNSEITDGTCQCKANFYGAPTSTVSGSIATAGCTACPFGGTSVAGSSSITDCTPAQTSNTGGCGAASTNATASAGTCVCKANYYGAPLDANDAALAVATKGCTGCPTNSESVAGSTALSACTVKAGYYIATKATSATVATGLVISATPANFYGTGGTQATHQTTNTITATKVACPFGGSSLVGAGFVEDCVPDCGASTVNTTSARGICVCAPNYYGTPLDTNDATLLVATKGCTACPTNSESAAGGAANLAACTVKAGYYIATESTSATDATSLVISIAPVNWYAPGGASASEQTDSTVAATRLACPHAGTTPATGKTALSECVPDCGAYASSVALGGTCVCKSTTYGAPTPTNAAPTTGCTACVVNKFVQTSYTAATGGSASSGVGAASTSVADCDVQPGVYISTQSTGTNNIASLVVTQIGVNKYAAGLSGTARVSADEATTAAALACPYAGTSAQAGGKLSDCTPSCGSGTDAVSLGGTCVCATTHYGTPQDAEGTTSGVVTQGCTACPTNSATAYTVAAPTGTLASCKVNPGYYIATESATAIDATGLVISQVPANSYGVGGAAASEQNDATVTATKIACVVKSSSPAGSDAISDCITDGGFYLSVASPSATGSGRIAKSETNRYAVGNTSISTTTAETPTACVYAGVSAIGSDSITDCTPSCGTVAVAGSGTCTCKAGRTGTPTPTTAAVTGGCTATLCAVNKYVSANVCTSCAPGTTIAKDGDASGANTACVKTKCAVNEYVKSNVCTTCAPGTTIAKDGDASGANTVCAKTKCAVNEYVKSNVCTPCAIGSTNVAGDDASGVDSTCDVDAVSSASRSDISFATIFVVIATLLACAAL